MKEPNLVPREGNCKKLAQNFAQNNSYTESFPQNPSAEEMRGKIVFFDRAATAANWDGHVGIVESFNPKTREVVLIEGNRGDEVKRITYNYDEHFLNKVPRGKGKGELTVMGMGDVDTYKQNKYAVERNLETSSKKGMELN